jgi:hypothetical protein
MTGSWVTHLVGSDGAVHTITIDKPPGNVVDIALCGQLLGAIESAAAADDGKVLVLRGAGKHFSFGASVEEHLPDKAPEMIGALGAVIRALIGFPYPTVVGVQGSCLGGGLELVLACGVVIADQAAKLACPEIQLGVLPPAATALLSRRDISFPGRRCHFGWRQGPSESHKVQRSRSGSSRLNASTSKSCSRRTTALKASRHSWRNVRRCGRTLELQSASGFLVKRAT